MDNDIIHQNLAKATLARVEKKAGSIRKQKELKEACEGFEAIFLNTLLKSMRNTLPKDTLFNSSHDLDTYQSMYDQYLSEELAKGKQSLGLKDFLYQQLKDSL